MLKIEIEKLFGHFDYKFCLLENQISILTGPNGFGKSTIIRCLKALENSDLNFFLELSFEKFEITKSYPDKECLQIRKEEGGLSINGESIDSKYIRSRAKGFNTGDNHRMQDIYSHVLRKMGGFLGEVYFIEEQRLIEEDSRRMLRVTRDNNYIRENKSFIEKVSIIPEKIKRKIDDIGKLYSLVSNNLDSTYPERLFKQKDGLTEEEFKKNIILMKEKTEKLNRNGILNIKALENVEFNPEDARALRVYFDDFDKKYRQYEELLERLELFREIVNERFQFKSVKTSSEYGLKIVDSITGKDVPLFNLSSGEKEIIVLFYTLLFEIPNGVIILIDEPEISLHIAWQRLFMQDLKRIVKIKNLKAVVATHSPQMVSGNRDIQVDLGELYKECVQ